MTIGCWVLLIVGIIIAIGGIAVALYYAHDEDFAVAITVFLVTLVVGAACIIGPIVYSNTEEGKRALKDQQSNFGNEIERTIKVIDIYGDVIQEYSGKFDVETNNDRYILFDDENGKRHIIYFGTSTIIIDEK